MSETTQSGSPIRPLGDRVVVRPLTEVEAGTMSASGIIIPDSVKKEKPELTMRVACALYRGYESYGQELNYSRVTAIDFQDDPKNMKDWLESQQIAG